MTRPRVRLELPPERPKRKGNPNWVKGVSQNPNGRTPGARNKVTLEVKRALLAGLNIAGSVVPEIPDNPVSALIKQLYPNAEGIDKYMAWLALVKPEVAGRIIEKVIPIALTGKDDGPIQTHHTYTTPEDLVAVLRQRGLPLPETLIDVTPSRGRMIEHVEAQAEAADDDDE